MTEYRLSQFDPTSTKEHRVWLIIGPRGSGKTVVLKDLLYHTKKRYHVPFAFTATNSTAEMFRELIPSTFVNDKGYNYETADKILAQAKKMTRLKKKNKNFLMVLDDVAFDKKIFQSDCQRELHLNGRHSKITLFNTTQYVMTRISHL